MCNHSRQSSLLRSTLSSGLLSLAEPSSLEEFHREHLQRRPQHHHSSFSFSDEEESITHPINNHQTTKRARSYCFLGLLEIGNSSQSDKMDLLSDQFSLLSSTSVRNSMDGDSIHDQSTPRKRPCRGLVRSQRSSHLQSLESLSDLDDSTTTTTSSS